jgi:hypothetical protein
LFSLLIAVIIVSHLAMLWTFLPIVVNGLTLLLGLQSSAVGAVFTLLMVLPNFMFTLSHAIQFFGNIFKNHHLQQESTRDKIDEFKTLNEQGRPLTLISRVLLLPIWLLQGFLRYGLVLLHLMAEAVQSSAAFWVFPSIIMICIGAISNACVDINYIQKSPMIYYFSLFLLFLPLLVASSVEYVASLLIADNAKNFKECWLICHDYVYGNDKHNEKAIVPGGEGTKNNFWQKVAVVCKNDGTKSELSVQLYEELTTSTQTV